MVKEKREVALIQTLLPRYHTQSHAGPVVLWEDELPGQGVRIMKMDKNMRKRGFTLIELLVVIAIIAILLAILVPGLGKAKQLVKKSICKNDIRQQCLGAILYGEQNNGSVPTSPAGNWFWDLSFWTTNQISQESGIDYKSFFCPVNQKHNPDDARFWQYAYVFEWAGVNLMQPQQLRDETNLPPDRQKNYYFRVLPFVYFFDKVDAAGNSRFPAKLETGEKAVWITKLSSLRNASATLMIMDAVISDRNNTNFSDIRTGGAWPNFGVPDTTNHLTQRRVIGGGSMEVVPEGGSIGFADGHVEWRKFEEMQHRLTWGQWFWW
jgi:prepilin-type N-terminal cleavage/methylation domain-containing protein/prepilin-type processing-associated H-X9-DG protein